MTENADSVDSVESNQSHVFYREVSDLVDIWLRIHVGEHFTLNLICQQLGVTGRDARHLVATKLLNESKKVNPKISKDGNDYFVFDLNEVSLNWKDAETERNIALQWPFGVDDDSGFAFENSVIIPEKSLIVIAGETNTGKSVFCRNFLWCNMLNHRCTYFSSETSAYDFAEYAGRMTWRNPLNGNGQPVFDLIQRTRDFVSCIRPNEINIVDWLIQGEPFYNVGMTLEMMKERLDRGIILVAIQKDPSKQWGIGGMFSEHLASLYLVMGYNKLFVKKAKKWTGVNPNNTMYGFDIVDYGTHFHRIRQIKECPKCHGRGRTGKGAQCDDCYGYGYVDI